MGLSPCASKSNHLDVWMSLSLGPILCQLKYEEICHCVFYSTLLVPSLLSCHTCHCHYLSSPVPHSLILIFLSALAPCPGRQEVGEWGIRLRRLSHDICGVTRRRAIMFYDLPPGTYVSQGGLTVKYRKGSTWQERQRWLKGKRRGISNILRKHGARRVLVSCRRKE